MKFNPERHHRQSIRLKGYDYTQTGAYFVTIVTQDRACLFGDVVDGEMRLNEVGRVAEACWHMIPRHFPNADVDALIVMPNHVHGIIVIVDHPVGATHASPPPGSPPPGSPPPGSPPPGSPPPGSPPPPRGPQRQSIGAIIGSFKSAATKQIHNLPNFANAPIWQRNYYEHIIRDDDSLNRIRQYIMDNPVWWAFDRENPAATAPEPEDT